MILEGTYFFCNKKGRLDDSTDLLVLQRVSLKFTVQTYNRIASYIHDHMHHTAL